MLRLLSIGGACLALALAAGCGGDDNAGGGGGGSDQAAAPPTQASADSAAGSETSSTATSGDTIVIHMKGFAFTPGTVKAKVGQKIEWVNDDDAPHNATAQGEGDLKTETVNKGGTVTFTPSAAGTIQYICTIHPNMKGTLEVTQ